MCVYVLGEGGEGACLNRYISVTSWPPKQKFLAPFLFASTSYSLQRKIREVEKKF